MVFKRKIQAAIAFPFLILSSFLVSRPLYARDVIDTANRLSQTMTKLGMAISVGGIVLCGIYFVCGRQDANTKLTQCLFGVICIWGVQTLISTVSSVA